MKLLDAAADIFALPSTWQHALRRYFVGIVLIAIAIIVDHWWETSTPVFLVGYAIGGLTVYGSFVRKSSN